MIPKFKSYNNDIFEININKLPIETIFNVLFNEAKSKGIVNQPIESSISTEALQILSKYSLEGKLMVCSSILENAESLQTLSISNELIQEVSMLLGTNSAEYSSISLMRIVFDEKWAVYTIHRNNL